MNFHSRPPSPRGAGHWQPVDLRARIANRNAWFRRAIIRCLNNRKIVKTIVQVISRSFLIQRQATAGLRFYISLPKRSRLRSAETKNHQKFNTRNPSSSSPSTPKYTPTTRKNQRRRPSRENKTPSIAWSGGGSSGKFAKSSRSEDFHTTRRCSKRWRNKNMRRSWSLPRH